MPCSLRCIAATPAIAALLLLSHPPAQAQTIVLPGAICGSSRSIDMPIPMRRSSSHDDDQGCPSGCHAVRATRKCDRAADDEA